MLSWAALFIAVLALWTACKGIDRLSDASHKQTRVLNAIVDWIAAATQTRERLGRALSSEDLPEYKEEG